MPGVPLSELDNNDAVQFQIQSSHVAAADSSHKQLERFNDGWWYEVDESGAGLPVGEFGELQAATLASGVLAAGPQSAAYLVSAETGSLDLLTSITGTIEGTMILLKAATGHRITLDHLAGNLYSPLGTDVHFTGAQLVLLVNFDGTNLAVLNAARSHRYEDTVTTIESTTSEQTITLGTVGGYEMGATGAIVIEIIGRGTNGAGGARSETIWFKLGGTNCVGAIPDPASGAFSFHIRVVIKNTATGTQSSVNHGTLEDTSAIHGIANAGTSSIDTTVNNTLAISITPEDTNLSLTILGVEWYVLPSDS